MLNSDLYSPEPTHQVNKMNVEFSTHSHNRYTGRVFLEDILRPERRIVKKKKKKVLGNFTSITKPNQI